MCPFVRNMCPIVRNMCPIVRNMCPLVRNMCPDPQDGAHQRPHLGQEQFRILKIHQIMAIQVFIFGSDLTSSHDLRCRSEDEYLPVIGLSWLGASCPS